MKPEDLKPPFLERTTAIDDRVWYVDQKNNQFVFPGWRHPDLFGNNNPIHIEYCSGNGAWIAAKAKENPQINWIAVEYQFSRARKIWSKIKNQEIGNLIVVCAEAFYVTERYFPLESIEAVYINFPDPWPKRRHAKYRLMQTPFIQQLNRILCNNGSVTFVTDDEEYSKWTIARMHKENEFKSQYADPFFSTEEKSYGTSYFDQLWREKGKKILYHRFYKT